MRLMFSVLVSVSFSDQYWQHPVCIMLPSLLSSTQDCNHKNRTPHMSTKDTGQYLSRLLTSDDIFPIPMCYGRLYISFQWPTKSSPPVTDILNNRGKDQTSCGEDDRKGKLGGGSYKILGKVAKKGGERYRDRGKGIDIIRMLWEEVDIEFGGC